MTYIQDQQRRLHFEEPINIQFTSVRPLLGLLTVILPLFIYFKSVT